jgi:hypothetical protein
VASRESIQLRQKGASCVKSDSLQDYVARRDARRHSASGQADVQQVFCDYSVAYTFLSLANSRYVSVELGYTGIRQNMLRARATVPRAWELFFLCFDDTYDYILSVGADRFVSVEVGYTGPYYAMLRARATVPDLWERFVIACNTYCTIQSAQNQLYTSAELGYPGGDNGMLRARATVVKLWEQFG